MGAESTGLLGPRVHQTLTLKCICGKVEDLLMGKIKNIVDEYPLDDEI